MLYMTAPDGQAANIAIEDKIGKPLREKDMGNVAKIANTVVTLGKEGQTLKSLGGGWGGRSISGQS